MLLDAHCHVDHYSDPHRVLEEAKKREISILAVTNLPSHFNEGLPHLFPYKNVKQALGLHPLKCKNHLSELSLFEKVVDQTNFIGEVGLDFSQGSKSTEKHQKELFQIVLEKSGQNKIFSVHSRQAESIVLDMLLHENVSHAIFHWFSGQFNILERAIREGYYFSINPAMCRTSRGKDIISRIPLERLLTESDGPFIGDKEKPYFPWDVEKVIKYLSVFHSIPVSKVEGQIWQNFRILTSGINNF